MLYDVQYRHLCLQSLTEIYEDRDLIQQQDTFIRTQLVQLYFDMIASGKSALQMHREKTASLDIDWAQIKSNKTCFCCLRRMPENTLSCRLSICEVCVRNLGNETSAFDSQYRIDACMLCHTGKLLVGLRPLTVGLRLLSIDGGGTLGVIAIGFMDVLQSVLGDIWRIQDLFDVSYGTSVGGFDDPTLASSSTDIGPGGLIVLILFLRQLPVSECVKMFDTLAKQLFPPSSNRTSILGRLRRLLRSWYRDGCHNAEILESYLQENLGSQGRLFDHVQGLIATKVGVTAATIDKGFPVLLTNYNGSGNWDEKCGTYGGCPFPVPC